MKLVNRFIVLMVVLVIGLLVQGVLFGYLDQAKLPPAQLTAKLAKFPPQLGPWQAIEAPLEEPYDFADDYVRRHYVNTETGQVVLLWMVYSDVGEDRDHNPVVCQGVAGKIEDLSARQSIAVAGHPAPVQQHRFGSDDRHTYVYYWYYMLPSEQRANLSTVQQIYSEIRQPPAGMTIEVFWDPEQVARGFEERKSEHTAQSAIEFVKLVDAEAQRFVGPKANRGSARRPVKVLAPTQGEPG
jgi:hypothetical protein